VEGESPAVRVRTEEALPPDGTLTGLGRVMVTPVGTAPDQEAVKLTAELKPFTDETTIVVDLETPGVSVTTAGAGWVTKSGAADEMMVPEPVTIS
jgi:hypothetical protein